MDLDARSLERVPNSGSAEYARPAAHKRSGKWIPKDPWAKAAVIWATVQLLIIVLLEAIVLKKHADNNDQLKLALGQDKNAIANASALTIYHALFMVAQVFQWVLAADAVHTYSMIEMVSTTLFNCALFAYAGMQYKQAKDIADGISRSPNFEATTGLLNAHPASTMEIIIVCAMGFFVVGWIVLSQRLYRVFGWSIFKELGADISVRNRLKLYHIYLMLLKLDVFFFIGFDVQYLILVILSGNSGGSPNEKWIHGFGAIPFTLVLLVIAYMAVRRESKILMTATLLGLSGGIGYLISKLVDVLRKGDQPKYSGSKNSLTFFEAITLGMCVATFIFALLTFRNFGKGLKEQLSKSRRGDLEMDNMQRGRQGRQKDTPRYTLE
ncbi:uncharacterized protein EV422DRAFT_135073 [Fimicolochytrium jonesii]|uniref:uncharacterized protein n=1 Tax=Fimicolochytrium jonesii TaxID=1396493 RepID=UPI0022FE2764|nr:uncharacterized protein EV422DRAFT_135073 [Fimicolochytrium jonesii]KAI8825647.1 hypothetical protein EV422DRAFT_135073 [Fimicolochytrium jonesii]